MIRSLLFGRPQSRPLGRIQALRAQAGSSSCCTPPRISSSELSRHLVVRRASSSSSSSTSSTSPPKSASNKSQPHPRPPPQPQFGMLLSVFTPQSHLDTRILISRATTEVPARSIIYHIGTPRIMFLGALKLTTVFVFGFFAVVVIPGYVSAGQPLWQTAGCEQPPTSPHPTQLTR